METMSYQGFDSVFHHIKEFGRYQAVAYFGSCFLILPLGMQLVCLVFAVGTPQFHCAQVNTTCTPNKCCDNCTSYSFDGPFTSIVSDWNLICDRAHLAAITQSVFMAGMLAGSIIFGIASDAFGRRKIIYFCSLVMVSFAVGSAFADCLSVFALLRFVVGASLTGVMISHYVFFIELVGPSKRAMVGKMVNVYWVTSASLTALMAYFIRDWSNLIVACSLPLLIVFLFWRVFPESARWLALKGKRIEAYEFLSKFGAKDGKLLDKDVIMDALETTDNDQANTETMLKRLTDLIKAKKLRKRMLILCFLWMSTTMSFYGFMLYVPNLSGSLYLNLFLLFLVDLPHTPIGWFLIQTIGRRLTISMFYLFGGGTCLLSLAVKDYPKVVIAITMLGKFFCSAAFSVVYIYTTELFPTAIRNVAVGIGSMSGRIGSIIAPFIVMLSQLPNLSVTLPIVILGAVTVAAGLVVLCLPETLGKSMYQTVEEAESSPDSYKIPCSFPWRQDFRKIPVKDVDEDVIDETKI